MKSEEHRTRREKRLCARIFGEDGDLFREESATLGQVVINQPEIREVDMPQNNP